MNERIRELIEEATSSRYQHDPKTMMTDRVQEFNKEKFAEMIVRECANYAFSDDQDNKAMLKHFGVAE